jgi:predicted PurR-regulated permease PerM
MKEKIFAIFSQNPEQTKEIKEWLNRRNIHLKEFNKSFDYFIDTFLYVLMFVLGIFLIFSGQLLLDLYRDWFLKNKFSIFLLTGGVLIVIIFLLIIKFSDSFGQIRKSNKKMTEIYKEAKDKYSGKIMKAEK